MRTFVGMKRLLVAVVCLLGLACPRLQAQQVDLDSVEISLLTCSPHEEIYSLYGHTALRILDKRPGGGDLAVNYGLFSFDKPFFVARFIFGLTDYEMGVAPFQAFCNEYRYYGSEVTEQVLNLSNGEKERILAAVAENYMPENRVYRYNIFHDNCTTRAIDMVLNHLSVSEEAFRHEKKEDSYPTFREMVHSCNGHHPWVSFGSDMLLGFQADRRTTHRDWLFLPAHAMEDFAGMSIVEGSKSRALVKETRTAVEGGVQTVESDFPLRPRTVFLLLLVLTLIISMVEWRLKKTFWGYDALLMVLCGLAGTVLFLMVFSQHPTVSLNFQLLLLNPLPLFLVWRMIKRTRARKRDRQYVLWTVLICLFFAMGFVQQYAEGMYLLASSLLIRNVKGILLHCKRCPLAK